MGLICTANRVGEAAPAPMDAAVASMTTLNKSAAEISRSYDVHAATDVTGFSFLGHLHEMMGGRLSCRHRRQTLCRSCRVRGRAADDCLYTCRRSAQPQPHRAFRPVRKCKPFAMQEILFDPQTSGGLLLAVAPEEAATPPEHELQKAGLPAQHRGRNHRRSRTPKSVVSYPE